MGIRYYLKRPFHVKRCDIYKVRFIYVGMCIYVFMKCINPKVLCILERLVSLT